MINGEVCAQHDTCFVVHDERTVGGKTVQCPLCEAESKIEDLKDELASVTEARDVLREEVRSLGQGE